MADSGTALRTSDLVLTLVQCGGITGLEMRAVLKLSELPPVDADGVRGLLRRVLAEAKRSGVEPSAVPDACEYELTVSEVGAEQRIVTRDGCAHPGRARADRVAAPASHPRPGLTGDAPDRARGDLRPYCRAEGRSRIGFGGDVMTHSAPARRARLRPTADLVRERDVHAPGARREADFDRGAYDSLKWLVEGGPGPLTGELVGLPIPAAVIVHELAVAEAVLSTSPGRCHRYAASVLEALMWAELATSAPPRAAIRGSAVREARPGRPGQATAV